MLSVGILAHNENWSDTLREAVKNFDFSVSGWIKPEPVPNGELDDLIERSTLIWIPEKLNDDMEAATRVIRRSRHLLLGFPVTEFVGEAFSLLKLAQEAQVLVQVGHQERYHPALRSCLPHLINPRAIYLNHHLTSLPDPDLSPYFLFEMVSDLALLLPLIQAPVKKVRSHAGLTPDREPVSIDIRVEFHNGVLISLLYRSRMEKPAHRIEIIQPESILEIDLLAGTSHRAVLRQADQKVVNREAIWKENASKPNSDQAFRPQVHDQVTQCISFLQTLNKGHLPLSPLEDGFHALEIAREVQSQICRY